MKITPELLCAAATFAAAGCSMLPSVGPDYREPERKLPDFALPDAGYPTTNLLESGEYKIAEDGDDWRVNITTNEIRSWWTRFNDPVLTGLVDSSVSNNLSYLMAQERLVQARWSLVGSYAAFLPHVGASGSATRMERGKDTSARWGTGSKLHRDVFTGGFDATWEIDIFGGSRRATEAATADFEAAGWNLADAWVSLTSEVGSQYIALRTTQQRIEVARDNLVLQRETYDILKSRLDSGIGDELAVSQSKYILEQTHAAIPPLLAQEEQLKNALAILTGLMPGALEEELSECPDRDWLVEPQKLSGIPLDMIRARPDVRAAERRLAAQVARVGVAQARWYPKLFINGSLGLDSVHPQKLFHRDALMGSIGPSFSWPIFQGGGIYAAVQAEEAKVNEACLAYDLAIQKAYAEIRDAYAAYTHEYHRYQALQAAVKAAEDAVSIAKDLYKNGLKDFTAVIDAQRSLLTLAESLVVSRGSISRHLIALYKALGGGVVVEAEEG